MQTTALQISQSMRRGIPGRMSVCIFSAFALVSVTLTFRAHAQSSATPPPSAVLGSVPSGSATSEVVKLTLRDAINMAIRYNLGEIESSENRRAARGQRLEALSLLLPQVSAGVTENVDQITTAPLGIKCMVRRRTARRNW